MTDDTSGIERTDASGPFVCIRCQRIETELPLTWTVTVEARRTSYVCDDCSRADIRGIESRLDPEWW